MIRWRSKEGSWLRTLVAVPGSFFTLWLVTLAITRWVPDDLLGLTLALVYLAVFLLWPVAALWALTVEDPRRTGLVMLGVSVASAAAALL